jgi:hypothetical protein
MTVKTIESELKAQGESNDPAYLAWKNAKVLHALEESTDRTKMIPSSAVWKKIGLEH